MSLEQLTDQMLTTAKDDYGTLTRLMIECLELVPFRLPAVGEAATKIARQYWTERSLPASVLEHARVDCWNYLDQRSASTNTVVPEYCAVRAVICVLYPEAPS